MAGDKEVCDWASAGVPFLGEDVTRRSGIGPTLSGRVKLERVPDVGVSLPIRHTLECGRCGGSAASGCRIFLISLVTGRGYRNCIQRFESNDTFICVNRFNLTIRRLVFDLPPYTQDLTISYNTINELPRDSFRNLTRLKYLQLDNNKLSILKPGAFSNLTVLNYLNLSYNNINSLSRGVFEGLEHLANLYLQQNSIAFLDLDVFVPLFSLKSLNLSENQLSNFSEVVDSIQPLQELKILMLCSNNIRFLNHIKRLPSNLSTIFLCKNKLQDLECHHELFQNTSYLDLSYNNISTSSMQNINLSKVNFLSVAYNHYFDVLKYLDNSTIKPENIDYSGLNLSNPTKLSQVCQHLRGRNISSLNLLGNQIQYLSENILESCSLSKTVDLSRNRLKNMICLKFLEPLRLESLIVEHNLLKQLINCSGAPKFPNLKSISFRYNRIWSVDANAFAFSPNLEELKLNINNILFLTSNTFWGLTKLKSLRLDNNLITDLYQSTFRSLKELTSLNLRNNRVSVIFKDVFYYLTNLTILDLGGNKITQVKIGAFNGLKSLSKLYLDRNQIKTITEETFRDVAVTLQVLDLMANQLRFESSRQNSSPFSELHNVYDLKLQAQQPFGLTVVPRNFFRGLTSLQALYLSQNRLTHLSPDTFHGLNQLRYLNLGDDCNGIQNLPPGIFSNLTNLQVLDLENMCLQTLDSEVFLNLTGLRRLQLAKNALRTIHIDLLQNLTNLQYLDLWKCPLTCTCDNAELQNWLIKSSPQIVNVYNLTCANDPNSYFHNFDTRVCDVILKLRLFCCSFVLVLLIMIIPIVYNKSYWRIRYNYFLFLSWLHERWNSDKDLYKYDAFVSYNAKDEEWVYQYMLPMLENNSSSNGLRLCLHHRDFQLGRYIIDNIVESIHSSRKTLCVVSRSYLKSEWCSLEMQLASYKLFDEMRDVLVLICLENIPDRELSTYHRMRKVMLKKTYIQWPKEPEAQKLFWAKLIKALKGSTTEDVEDSLLSTDEQTTLISR
ncbi:PREDICTED: toll-like receptor 13 [Nanorana parkeri]|uniref:toll-like receptor 13 n=1 Tax=Nanorana parkeri TaxID=125878 RepID=UPI0008546E74|nr:PREDICTED: toll-like receptor 13 [Nanorana parkeri]